MNTDSKYIGTLTKVLLLFSGALLVLSLFYPIWRIELDAPQYPEGLTLTIFANKIGGQLDIINGLNHYIGMKTIHANEFIEFAVLPYVISAYALACLVVIAIRKRTILYLLFGLLFQPLLSSSKTITSCIKFYRG